MRKRCLRLVAFGVCLGLFAGCFLTEPEDYAVITGTLLERGAYSGGIIHTSWLLVLPTDTAYWGQKVRLNLRRDTRIVYGDTTCVSAVMRRAMARTALCPVSFDDLTVGAAIEARVSTVMLLSDPPQVSAFSVVVERTQ